MCWPEMQWNARIADLSAQADPWVSTQWPVMPKNEAFVVSDDQPSMVTETFPAAFYICVVKSEHA
jgi:hypothetical protein